MAFRKKKTPTASNSSGHILGQLVFGGNSFASLLPCSQLRDARLGGLGERVGRIYDYIYTIQYIKFRIYVCVLHFHLLIRMPSRRQRMNACSNYRSEIARETREELKKRIRRFATV